MIPTSSSPPRSVSGAMVKEALSPFQPGTSDARDKNPAGAYLNQFKEIVELIERLPSAPELIGDILNWRATSYNDYFADAATKGRASAADVYASLNRCSGGRFEGAASDLDCKAIGAAAVIRRHYKTHGEAQPDIMMEICGRAGKNLREALGKANSLAARAQSMAGKADPVGGCPTAQA